MQLNTSTATQQVLGLHWLDSAQVEPCMGVNRTVHGSSEDYTMESPPEHCTSTDESTSKTIQTFAEFQGCGLGLDVSRCTNVSSRACLDKKLQRLDLGLGRLTSRSRLDYLSLVPKTLFCPNFASHINKWAKSAVAIMAVLTRIGNRSMHYLLTEVSG